MFKIFPSKGNSMNKHKQWIFGASLLGVTALAVPVFLHADGGLQGHGGGRPGMHRMFGGGAPIVSLALRHKDELKLTPEQAANLEKIRTQYRDQMEPLGEQLRTVEEEISKLSQETPADLVQIKTKIQESEKLRSELRYQRLEALENGKSILTQQQRDQLKSLLAGRHEQRRQQRQAS
jgi:Spy/CpxP family protein refolding chaperone